MPHAMIVVPKGLPLLLLLLVSITIHVQARGSKSCRHNCRIMELRVLLVMRMLCVRLMLLKLLVLLVLLMWMSVECTGERRRVRALLLRY
jgi:hypothetical protein